MKESEVIAILENIPVITEVTSEQRHDIEDLLKHRGFVALVGLMLAERQGHLVMLSNLKVGDMTQVQTFGVTQGLAKAVDRLRQTILECVAVPTDTKE